MSSVYQPKRKELAKVKVMSSDSFNKNRKNYKYVGSINRGFTNFITTKRNKKNGICSFIDDTSSLTKKTKNELVRFFSSYTNRTKGVAYLVTQKK